MENPRFTIALIYDFDGTLAPGNMQEYDFIPAVGKSNKEFWNDANILAETQDADPVLTYMARMIQEAQSKGLSLRREAFQESGRNIVYYNGVEGWFPRMNAYAAERGIRIFTIGIGSPKGAPIQIGGEFVKDEKGEMVVSRLNEKLLQTIAEKGNGGYIRASNAEFGLSEIVDEIEKMEKSELSTLRFDEYNEQFYWILWVVLGLLLLEGLLLDRRNPRLRKFNIFEKN